MSLATDLAGEVSIESRYQIPPWIYDIIVSKINKAIAIERDLCASIAETEAIESADYTYAVLASEAIARAIRARND